MPQTTNTFAVALSPLLPLGYPLLVGLTPAVGIGAELLTTQRASAQTALDWVDSGTKKYDQGDDLIY